VDQIDKKREVCQEPSIFDERSIADIHWEIKELYRSDKRPWVVGYSGGKDSTAALQLVLNAISELPQDERTKPIYVISSDTLVENPVIKEYIHSTHKKINRAAKAQGLPIEAHILRPILNDTFWVNLLGRGYPAPQTDFRWCTERLKIRNADRFILSKVAEHGEVITVLGTRKSESATRAQLMSLYKISGSILSRHSRFPGAYVYTPIENFSLEDVWEYLLTYQSPWGNNNAELLALYKNANAGECPLVVDDKTPPCGNSRFGCWVCTLVERDKSMEALVAGDEKWMEPLLKFRNLIMQTQIKEKKHIFRDPKRRHGKVDFNKNTAEVTYGPIKVIYRRGFLRRLLKMQKEFQDKYPEKNITLISEEELHEIRKIWQREGINQGDPIPKMYRDIFGSDLKWIRDDLGTFKEEDEEILLSICVSKGVPAELLFKLLEAERQSQGMSRRSSIFNKLEAILREEWRPLEEVIKEREKQIQKLLEASHDTH
jgi:DNA sulfur modification protein DndC